MAGLHQCTYDLGANDWGNHELESNANRKENARIEKGNLVITALKQPYTGADGVTQFPQSMLVDYVRVYNKC